MQRYYNLKSNDRLA